MSGTFSNPNVASLSDFLVFIATTMQVPADDLPANSPWPQIAYNAAMDIVASELQTIAPAVYVIALYNLAGHFLLLLTPDQSGQTFFADAAKQYGLTSFAIGPVTGASDQGTSDTLFVPEFYKTLSLQDYQYLLTPYGRTYLALAMNLSGLWGIT